MHRRTLALLATVGLLLVSGCTASGDDGTATDLTPAPVEEPTDVGSTP